MSVVIIGGAIHATIPLLDRDRELSSQKDLGDTYVKNIG